MPPWRLDAFCNSLQVKRLNGTFRAARGPAHKLQDQEARPSPLVADLLLGSGPGEAGPESGFDP
jgi:hypothetical protein